jgi:hypothetical protein
MVLHLSLANSLNRLVVKEISCIGPSFGLLSFEEKIDRLSWRELRICLLSFTKA